MNAPAPAAQTSIKPGQVLIRGRLQSVRKAGKSFLHLVTMPAPDEYSSPQTVEIIAATRLGDPQESVSLLCRVGGYRRNYKTTDDETGEIVQRQTADNKLFAEGA